MFHGKLIHFVNANCDLYKNEINTHRDDLVSIAVTLDHHGFLPRKTFAVYRVPHCPISIEAEYSVDPFLCNIFTIIYYGYRMTVQVLNSVLAVFPLAGKKEWDANCNQ